MGFMAHLLPFIEQQAFYDSVIEYTHRGPAPWATDNFADGRPGATGPKCPPCLPVGPDQRRQRHRLPQLPRQPRRHLDELGLARVAWGLRPRRQGEVGFANLKDGSSNTILFGEVAIGKTPRAPSLRSRGAFLPVGHPARRSAGSVPGGKGPNGMLTGTCQRAWARAAGDLVDGGAMPTASTPPSSPCCPQRAYAPPAKRKLGHAHRQQLPSGWQRENVAMGDSSVRFISETIDAGDPTRSINAARPGRQPARTTPGRRCGASGAAGTTGAGETVTLD